MKIGLLLVQVLFIAVAPVLGEQAEPFATGEVLVRFDRASAKRAVMDGLPEVLRDRFGVEAIEPLFAPERRRGKAAVGGGVDNWFRLTLNDGRNPDAVADEMAGMEGVEWVQPNYLRRFASSDVDSLFDRQWNLEEMGWERAEIGNGGEGVVVAVVDSGLDFDHPEMAGQVWVNPAEAKGEAGVDDDGNGYVDDLRGWDFSDAPGLPGEGDYLGRDADPTDESGHGTHVAGIIGAAADNRIGIAGVAPQARLMILRAGFNLPGGGFLEDDDLAAAIVYAVDNGAQVINMSWGDPFFSPVLRDVIRYADRSGCVLVAATGNEGGERAFYPARLPETIGVAAVAPGGQAISFSNRGPSVDLAAPGLGILSLAPGGNYGERSGTSMAAAHVSGLAALVLARHPHFTPRQVRGALALTARDIGAAGWDERFGAGIVQVAAEAVEQPAFLAFAEPEEGAVLSGERVDVRLDLEGIDFREVSWGGGLQPRAWTPLGESGEKGAEFVWETDGLVPGSYLLRARGTHQGHALEARIEVRLQRRPPNAGEVRLYRALDGADWGYLVEWWTDTPAGGLVRLLRDGEEVVRLPAIPERIRQRVELPNDLEEGRYEVEIETVVGDLRGKSVGVGVIDVEYRQTAWGMTRLARLMDGYLMPRIGDVDGDGEMELGLMPYAGLQYNQGSFFHLNGEEPAYRSSLLFIPWETGDWDGDGLNEIMAVDARRVRLIEARSEGGWPERVSWQQEDVWGGEVADLDGDGRGELLLRSVQNSFFQVFENRGNDTFEEVAVLRNPTSGSNQLGQRQVVGDLDGDGRGELLAGDDDGDLFLFEQVADDAFRTTWREEVDAPDTDARVIGGGSDLDGDGRPEFVVARLLQEPYLLRETGWRVSVYQAVGNDDFEEEWQVDVLGGGSSGNGVSVADFDGDGLAEFALALVPDLYLFRATGTDRYEPVWHASIGRTYRPASGDLDGDGRDELAFNADGGVEIFTRRQADAVLEAPAGFAARALDQSQAELAWRAVPGAADYRVYRDDGVIADGAGGLRFIDRGLSTGRIYRYFVVAVDAGGREGERSPVLEVTPESMPAVAEIRRLGERQLGVYFSLAVAVNYLEPFRFALEPGPGMPSSVSPDEGGHRVVLSFAEVLPDSGRFVLRMEGIEGVHGTPLESDRVEFELSPVVASTRALRAEVVSPTRIALYFSRAVPVPDESQAVFSLQPGDVRIAGVSGEGEVLWLDLAGERPLRPLGHAYELLIEGMEDGDGGRIDGRLVLRLAATDLSGAVPFPNPFRPDRGKLTFGFLTAEARVRIYDLGGMLIRRLAESDGDGGVEWDGRNQQGQAVASGIYLYQIESSGERVIGKFALVRE